MAFYKIIKDIHVLFGWCVKKSACFKGAAAPVIKVINVGGGV